MNIVTYRFIPPIKKSFPVRFEYSKVDVDRHMEVIMTEKMIYQAPDSQEQRDWLKGTGRSFHLLTNHKNSYMWAFRRNPERGVFQFTTYYHRDRQVEIGKRTDVNMPDPLDNQVLIEASMYDRLFILEINDTISGNFGYRFKNMSTGDSYEHKLFFGGLRLKKTRRIFPWFGGSFRPKKCHSFYTEEYF